MKSSLTVQNFNNQQKFENILFDVNRVIFEDVKTIGLVTHHSIFEHKNDKKKLLAKKVITPFGTKYKFN